jgi:hypothetical protein
MSWFAFFSRDLSKSQKKKARDLSMSPKKAKTNNLQTQTGPRWHNRTQGRNMKITEAKTNNLKHKPDQDGTTKHKDET